MSNRRTHSVLAFLAAMLLVAAPALAAEGHSHGDAKASKEHEAMMAEMMKYASPGEMHAFLKPFEGKWKTVNTMYMGDQKQTSEGTCERSWIMGGRFLLSKYSGMMMENMPFEGMEILGYDTRNNVVQSTWIDNMGTSMANSSKGTIDKAKKTMTVYTDFFDPMVGKPKTYKMVTTFVDDNTHKFMMIGNKDGKDFTEMEITYTRVN
ncbi:MAG TPA: DUF1579 domain-containing protein [Candidatus Eisenbacteria bacterium]|nr:DUF1579 domain-containing protein [Candidatus Eisenbacteria bacterium]